MFTGFNSSVSAALFDSLEENHWQPYTSTLRPPLPQGESSATFLLVRKSPRNTWRQEKCVCVRLLSADVYKLICDCLSQSLFHTMSVYCPSSFLCLLLFLCVFVFLYFCVPVCVCKRGKETRCRTYHVTFQIYVWLERLLFNMCLCTRLAVVKWHRIIKWTTNASCGFKTEYNVCGSGLWHLFSQLRKGQSDICPQHHQADTEISSNRARADVFLKLLKN